MRYQEEIKEVPDVEIKNEKISEKELQLAKKLVEQLTEKFDPKAFKDTYINELKKIIKAKASGKKIRVATTEKADSNVKDLMEVLKASIGSNKKRA